MKNSIHPRRTFQIMHPQGLIKIGLDSRLKIPTLNEWMRLLQSHFLRSNPPRNRGIRKSSHWSNQSQAKIVRMQSNVKSCNFKFDIPANAFSKSSSGLLNKQVLTWFWLNIHCIISITALYRSSNSSKLSINTQIALKRRYSFQACKGSICGCD